MACHGCNLGDAGEAVILFSPSFYFCIYLFIHFFFCSVLLINSVLVIIDLCIYFLCDSLCFHFRNITCVLNTPRLTNSCAIDRASFPSLVLSHKQGILPIWCCPIDRASCPYLVLSHRQGILPVSGAVP